MSRRSDRRTGETREPREYLVSIPSRDDIAAALENADAPLPLPALASLLGLIGNEEAVDGLTRRLRAMVRDGQLLENRAGRFGVARRMELLAGRIIGHPDGFAFVRPDTGEADIYLEPRQARRVLHGDRVLARIAGVDQRERPFGMVAEVISRANEEVVGRYFRDSGVGYVVPDNRCINQDLLIPAGEQGDASHGQIVVAQITQQPDAHTQPIARVASVLGNHMAPGMEVEIAIRAYNLPSVWPDEMAAEVADVPQSVDAAEIDGRVDLRDLPFVTIDGADARDFDDAVYCKASRDGYRLYVAIADVGHYVREGSVLNATARERGTSVYFPDRVIPMLPEELSNGICSLRPDVDRLVLVCELSLTQDGEPMKARFYNGVIHSHARLVYEDAAAWLEEPGTREPSLRNQVKLLHELYLQLRARREKRGALDIDSVEPKFVFNAVGKIERIETRERNDAHKLIEECMIAANVAAAEYLGRHKLPALYRIHARPEGEKLVSLRKFLAELGIALPGGERPEARHFAEVLNQNRHRPDAHLIQTMLMRSLKLAVYRGENAGHFGLALDAYAHFTSPIRRYPDLIVHRAIKRRLAREKTPQDAVEQIVVLAEETSMAERRADEATRDAVAWLKCEFMLEKVGLVFSGTISSVTSFGMFVQLKDIFVEGLVHVTALPDDYYQFDPAGHRLIGRRTNREFRIGQTVQVRVMRVSLDDRQIDFALSEEALASKRKRR